MNCSNCGKSFAQLYDEEICGSCTIAMYEPYSDEFPDEDEMYLCLGSDEVEDIDDLPF